MEDNSLFNNYKHPLLNPLIANHVLEFLESSITSQDRSSVRSVCSLWNDLTFHQWRLSSTLTIGPPSLLDPHLTNESPPKYIPIDEFVYRLGNPHNDPYKLTQFPFSSYRFHSINFGDPLQFFDVIYSSDFSFWGIFTPFAKSITLESCSLPGEHLDLFEHLLIPHFQTTQRLTLRNTLISPKRPYSYHATVQPKIYNRFYRGKLSNINYLSLDGGRLPIDPFQMLLITPNITHLKVRNSAFLEMNFGTLFYFALLNCNDPMNPDPLKIKTLDVIHSQFFLETCHPIDHHLGKFQMPLEYLSLNLEPYMGYYPNYRHFETYDHSNDQDIRHILQPVLQFQSKTLKIAKIFRPPVFAISQTPIFTETLQVLTELYLWGNLIDNFSFLKFTPILKVLHIETKCISKQDQMAKMFYPNNKEDELITFRDRFKPFSGDLMKNTKLEDKESITLPDLRQLYIENGFELEDTVETLKRWMPNLKRFWGTLRCVDFSMVCKHMNNLEELGLLLESDGITDSVLTEGMYNLRNLTELKRFVYKSPCGQSQLGDDSIYNGFLKIPELRSIEICVSSKMSLKAETDLKQHVTQVECIRNYSCHKEWECCKYARFTNDVLAYHENSKE